MSTETRIYIVTTADGMVHLVRAAHPARALRHVYRLASVEVATQDDLVDAMTAGVKVETAGDEQEV